MPSGPLSNAVGGLPRRLFYYNLGFWRDPVIGRILALKGAPLALGLPQAGDGVAVWGRSPYAARGERVAQARGAPLVRLEDAFLRSVHPARARASSPLGLLIDPHGVHFDSAQPSLIERLCAEAPLDDTALLDRARDGIARLTALHLSKYNHHDPSLTPPKAGYVLVIDQSFGDASIAHGGAGKNTFREMLAVAQIENPRARIVVKTHPETALGLRAGHYGPQEGIEIETRPLSPWALLEGAIAVYTVSSLMGFEAILAGHKPRVFGQPFYAGWGLTLDETPVARRRRRLTRAQLFAVSHILAPSYYCRMRDRLCSFEEAVDQLEAESRAYREDRAGYVAAGMRLWKRGPLNRAFGREKAVVFDDKAPVARAQALGRPLMVWAGKSADPALKGAAMIRVEDGFLRSKGLGAALVPPASLVCDTRGIYYDPAAPSDLETLIATPCPPWAEARGARLIARLRALNLTKYNLKGAAPTLPEGFKVLVPGQVEDDASVLRGGGAIRSNASLLAEARRLYPKAQIIYKPHPDVEAGLRAGGAGEADFTAHGADPLALIAASDAVVTMTSLLGFEALLRDKPVTCLGAPFYAGWGLTRDLSPVPARRQHRPSLAALAYAALIAYPRYFDPVSGAPASAELVAERLAQGVSGQSKSLKILAKLQGALASYAHLWR